MVSQPALMRRWLLRRDARAPFWKRLDYDAVDRPQYGYGVLQAARQAKLLGIPAISVLEFGVTDGAGLRALERIAEQVEKEEGVRISVYGFGTPARGTPAPGGARDLPFAWRAGRRRTPVKSVESGLTRAKLLLGETRQAVPRFLFTMYPAPVGFISIDVDYCTTALEALRVLEATSEFLLPRVFVYLDDVIGDDLETHCEFVGELAAVREFNEQHEHRKIGRIHGLRHKRIIPAWWNDVMFVAHLMDHPLYAKYIKP